MAFVCVKVNLMGNDFEIMIVGAGPSGSFAAERLARAGLRVALFDGRPEHEPKACGGGVTSKALKEWPHLHQAIGRSIDEVEMYSPAGRRLKLKLAEPFNIYSRRALDAYLIEQARSAGAHIIKERVRVVEGREGAPYWTVHAANGMSQWTGAWLLAADGANSRIAHKLAGALPASEMEVAFGYRAPMPEHNEVPTIVAFLPKWAGYAWAFPRLDHISFGIATSQDAFNHEALDRLLWKFIVNYYKAPHTRKAKLWEEAQTSHDNAPPDGIEATLRATIERYAARIPGLAAKTWDTRRTQGEGWALLGDAAGFADPVTGEGIYYALKSAELFSQAYLEKNAARYEEYWRTSFGRELKRAAEMRSRFYGNFWGAPFTERMLEFARAHRGIRRVLGELVAGDQGYVDLKRVLARRALCPL